MAVTLLAATAATASAGRAPTPYDGAGKIERRLAGAGTSELSAFVSFDHPVRDADLDRLRAVGVSAMHRFRLIPTVGLLAPLATLRRIAAWDDVTAIRSNDPVRFLTDRSKGATRVDKARAARPAGLGLTGAGVTVAVLDTGFDQTHPDFEGRIAKLLNFEGGWIYDNPDDGEYSDQMAEQTAPYAGVDESGHGSHVAGTILGTGKAAVNGVDFSGMAPGAKLVGMKVAGGPQLARDVGWEINCMIAIEYAVEHARELGIKIVSNSWATYEVDDPASEPVILMIDAAVRHGLTMVFAAGNGGPGDDTVAWPGAMGSVVTVGSTAKTSPYEVSRFSSRGYQVDVAAPGASIYSVRARNTAAGIQSVPAAGANGVNYMAISGTSMATPHVAGIAALMYQANPRLTPALVAEILERTAVDLGDRGKDTDYGWGFVDAFRAAQVSSCLARVRGAVRENCFRAVRALPRSRWSSDARDPGNRDM